MISVPVWRPERAHRFFNFCARWFRGRLSVPEPTIRTSPDVLY